MSFAVIKTGGKQYLVSPDKQLKIEKIDGQAGDKVSFDVLFLSDDKGDKVELGQPIVTGQKVEAEILEQGKERTVRVVKYKAKTRYHKVYGHRQPYTRIKVLKVGKDMAKKTEAKKPAAKKAPVKKTAAKPVTKKAPVKKTTATEKK